MALSCGLSSPRKGNPEPPTAVPVMTQVINPWVTLVTTASPHRCCLGSAAAHSACIPAWLSCGSSIASPRSRETGSGQELADLGQSLAFPLPSWVTSLKPSRLSEPPWPVLGDGGNFQSHAFLKAGHGHGNAGPGCKGSYSTFKFRLGLAARSSLLKRFVRLAVSLNFKKLVASN